MSDARAPITFDPAALTGAQRTGIACVLCHKRWPRPMTVVGTVPAPSVPAGADGTGAAGDPVLACEDCAAAIDNAVVSAASEECVPRSERHRAHRRRWLPRVLIR